MEIGDIFIYIYIYIQIYMVRVRHISGAGPVVHNVGGVKCPPLSKT